MSMTSLELKLMAVQNTILFTPILTRRLTKKVMVYMQTSHLELHLFL